KIGGRIQIVDALVRRRAAEKALFLNMPGRTPVASSRLYRAMHDSEALPAPPPPREILVEHASIPVAELEDLLSEPNADEAPEAPKAPESPVQSATEAAAESVREQMIRILGENGDKVSPAPPPASTDGATPEEITAAISELAGEMSGTPVQKSVWPAQEDLPPPPELDPQIDPIDHGGEILQPIAEADVIDDLEEVDVSPESIERAVERNHANGTTAQSGGWLAALPFGILALIGAALSGYGLASQFGLIQSGRTIEDTMAIYMPPFLILLGVFLFVAMGYYFFRSLSVDD
ncbi:MAG: hypothetical protein AAF331_07290, partial [Pseudomonadota bacterium]